MKISKSVAWTLKLVKTVFSLALLTLPAIAGVMPSLAIPALLVIVGGHFSILWILLGMYLYKSLYIFWWVFGLEFLLVNIDDALDNRVMAKTFKFLCRFKPFGALVDSGCMGRRYERFGLAIVYASSAVPVFFTKIGTCVCSVTKSKKALFWFWLGAMTNATYSTLLRNEVAWLIMGVGKVIVWPFKEIIELL